MGLKANKQITIDVELFLILKTLDFNVSEYCNEKLWDYVVNIRGTKGCDENVQNVEEEIKELEKKKLDLENENKLREARDKAGITDEHIKFLESMSTDIMMAKDMKLAWFNKFGQEKQWSELLDLKRSWT
jgi:hypothetical protein